MVEAFPAVKAGPPADRSVAGRDQAGGPGLRDKSFHDFRTYPLSPEGLAHLDEVDLAHHTDGRRVSWVAVDLDARYLHTIELHSEQARDREEVPLRPPVGVEIGTGADAIAERTPREGGGGRSQLLNEVKAHGTIMANQQPAAVPGLSNVGVLAVVVADVNCRQLVPTLEK